MSNRFVIVNADDFGLSEGVNRGIIEAHERGIVTSASLMVLKPSAATAAAYSRTHPRLGVGLHLDLGEWAYEGGAWACRYRVVALDDHEAITRELELQLADFRRLVGRDPTHIDSHQHVHRDEPIRSAALELAGGLKVPLRHFSPETLHCGRFYGQSKLGLPLPAAISVESLSAILTELPPGRTEIGCHPGRLAAEESPYGRERSIEVDVLTDPRIRTLVIEEGITLISFRDMTDSL